MLASTNYGADSSGLICGYRFSVGGHGEPIGSDEAIAWLASTGVADGFVWLHFNLAHAATQKWLREHAALSDVFHESLGAGSRSTRVELDDGTLVAVVNDVHYDFDFEPSDISTLWLSVDRRLVVSARLQPLRSIDRLRDAVKRGASLRSTVELLVHLMHDQGDVLVGIVRSATERVDALEDQLLAGRIEKRRANLGTLRRLLVRLQRLLAPEPAALFRLLQKPPLWIGEDDLQDLRQSTEEFNVALIDMAALQERIKLLQEEIAGRVAEENNRSLFVLTVVTVLALPINIIAGLLGMNVGGIPLAQSPYGFWIVVAIIVTFTLVAGWFAFRKRQDRDQT
jgi:zinc transporter